MSIKPIIAANWKMNKTPNEGIEFFDEMKSNFLGDEDITIIIGTCHCQNYSKERNLHHH